MPANLQLESPSWRAYPTVASGVYDFGLNADGTKSGRTLRGVDVWAAGTLGVEDIEGIAKARTFSAPFPVRWVVQIRKIFDTGTGGTLTIAPATDVDPLH